MTSQAMTHEMADHLAGETCPGCDCEMLVSDEGQTVLIRCDCGSVFALGQPSTLSPAA